MHASRSWEIGLLNFRSRTTELPVLGIFLGEVVKDLGVCDADTVGIVRLHFLRMQYFAREG
jgi:hypothetical protein